MFDRLDNIRKHVVEDVRTALAKDPAAKSALEVALLYPGLHAVWCYRIAHYLWTGDHRLVARALSEVARFCTGVEIHPAATIGRRLFIDHGQGVVIGETAEIGDDVLMYHGVTLGGNSMRREKRHPTVEDCATVGANATLLGDIAIGEGATVGAGSVVTESVPPGATARGVPAEITARADPSEEATNPSSTDSEPHWLADC
ncbi:MAG: serine O-acetyltransferase [Halorientalis sp.]